VAHVVDPYPDMFQVALEDGPADRFRFDDQKRVAETQAASGRRRRVDLHFQGKFEPEAGPHLCSDVTHISPFINCTTVDRSPAPRPAPSAVGLGSLLAWVEFPHNMIDDIRGDADACISIETFISNVVGFTVWQARGPNENVARFA